MKTKGGGKAKGSAFERTICKQLSLWMSCGYKEDLFWRSAMSGGRATVARGKGVSVRQAGDITAVASEGHALTDNFYIECKHYRDLGIKGFLLKGTGTLRAFWLKAVVEASAYGKRPFLIARENGFPTIALIKPGVIDPIFGKPRAKLHWGHNDEADLWLFDDILAVVPPLQMERIARL